MASPFVSTRAPRCSSYVRSLNSSLRDLFLSAPTRQQTIRGKKQLSQSKSVPIRLLKDVRRYGSQGTLLKVAPGIMRNSFFPGKKAEYLTLPLLKELGLTKADLPERDVTYVPIVKPRTQPRGSSYEGYEGYQGFKEIEAPVSIDLDLLTPARATQILDLLLPSNLDFYRQPIPSSLQEPASTTSLTTLPQNAIYGSVSTSDIANSIRSLLANDEEGTRVVISADDISFVGQGGERAVKNLGVFEFEVRLRGGGDVVRRTIRISPSD